MSDQNDQETGKSRLSLRPAGGRLELGKTVDAGSVRQSFSHGRSKTVQVEVVKKRVVAPSPVRPGIGVPAARTLGPAPAAPAPEAAPMFIAMNRFRVAPGNEEAFEATWRNRESHLHEVPGFRSFHLMKGPVRADHVLYASHSTWESEAALLPVPVGESMIIPATDAQAAAASAE
jgi:hypothetical protein